MQTVSISNFGPSIVKERFILTFADLTAAALTQTVNLKSLPKGSVVLAVVAKPDVAFGGGTIATMTLKIGLAAGAADTILAASDVMAAVADTTLYTSNAKGTPLVSTAAADTLTATFTSTVDNLNHATAGQVHIDVFYFFMEDLTGTAPVGNSLTTGGLL